MLEIQNRPLKSLSVGAATDWARRKANETGRTQYVVRSFTDAADYYFTGKLSPSEELRRVKTIKPGDTIASMVPGRLAELLDGMVGK